MNPTLESGGLRGTSTLYTYVNCDLACLDIWTKRMWWGQNSGDKSFVIQEHNQVFKGDIVIYKYDDVVTTSNKM